MEATIILPTLQKLSDNPHFQISQAFHSIILLVSVSGLPICFEASISPKHSSHKVDCTEQNGRSTW
jgi:hypothetical protein